MARKKLPITIQNELFKKYKNEIEFRFTNESAPYCHVPEKIIYLCLDKYFNPTVNSVFDMMHEIGHIKTNLPGMKRCEEEYHATVWAIKEAKKYKLEIPQKRKDVYQNYIWYWRERGIKSRAKVIPSKEDLILNW